MMRRDRGATLVEFALVAGIFFMLVFSIIEISRYMVIRGLLTKAAQVALSHAQKSRDFHLDVRPCGVGDALCLAQRNAYRDKRDEISSVASKLATSAFLSAAGSSATPRLKEYRVDESDGFSKNHPILILRPLESGMLLPDNIAVSHPTTSGTNSSDPWIQLQSEHPYEVRMSARVSPLLPWPIVPSVFDIGVVVRGYPEVPRTTKIPPALGLPLPPVPGTTTTTTTAGTTTTSGTTGTTSGTTTTTGGCGAGFWECGGGCIPDCPSTKPVQTNACTCECMTGQTACSAPQDSMCLSCNAATEVPNAASCACDCKPGFITSPSTGACVPDACPQGQIKCYSGQCHPGCGVHTYLDLVNCTCVQQGP